MENKRVVLASKSPRRKELLGELISRFEIASAEVDETLPDRMHPRDGVELLAVRKGEAVTCSFPEDTLILSSDTLVELDGEALGKPEDFDDACRILRKLSGRGHNVHTGVAVHYRGRVFSGVATSQVFFRDLSDRIIEDYVRTGEPMDKAGAYGIQGRGGNLVEKYVGDFDTIVGLSLRLCKELFAKALELDDDR